MAALPPYASTGQVAWHYGFRVICALIFLFLILPILIIIPLSFTASDFFTFTPEILQQIDATLVQRGMERWTLLAWRPPARSSAGPPTKR